MNTSVPSGEQFEIGFAQQRAVIVEVGGGIRSYRDGDRDILHPYDLDAMCDGAHGAALVPWPNRLADGKYSFNGSDHQVALTEPAKHNAIHGFGRWRSWSAAEHSASRVVMETTIHPMRGYPFAISMRIEYALGEEGLTVTSRATNIGSETLPYGYGQHPYLSPGDGLVDDCVLQLGAATRICTDPDRQLPIGAEPVDGTDFDFREGKLLGGLHIDFAFTDLHRDDDARAWVQLTGTDGRSAQLWVDESFVLIELYTADTLAKPRRRRGLGAEPMTCPPNAFATGTNVISLAPGDEAVTHWGARLR